MAQPLIWPSKGPLESLDYWITWDDLLEPDEVIVTHTWTVPAPLNKVSQVDQDQESRVLISGGVDGDPYNVICTIVTDAPRTFSRSIELACETKTT